MYTGPRIVNSNLTLYLDAANTKSYPGSGTVWNNLGSLNVDGLLVNAPTFSNSIVTFDSSLSQRISIEYRPEWRLAGSNTISFWSNAAASNDRCAVSYEKGSWQGYMVTPTGVFYSSVVGSNDVALTFTKNAGEWCMLTWVINRVANFYYLYKNATLVGSKAITQPDLTGVFSSGQLTVGGNNTVTSRYYTGSISTVQFYTSALTSDEISQNYNATKSRFGL